MIANTLVLAQMGTPVGICEAYSQMTGTDKAKAKRGHKAGRAYTRRPSLRASPLPVLFIITQGDHDGRIVAQHRGGKLAIPLLDPIIIYQIIGKCFRNSLIHFRFPLSGV